MRGEKMDKIVNNEIVEQVKKAMPEEESLYDVAELFKVFGDSTRIRIICALFDHEMCVYDFKPEALKFYCEYGVKIGKAKIEEIEDIEILRFIENGYRVQYMEVNSDTIAVDTPHDLLRVINYIKEHSID